ncbi:hypothetical protein FS837_009672 [Tulasnella sp. UAMH 9824]|nr:hypothetical protein FS837_009672 [Tulasnella sp. UAMH 9824]
MLPALGNQDLKLLQNLITAEKLVISRLALLFTLSSLGTKLNVVDDSAQTLADVWAKAADSLKAWGAEEGDDLSDVLNRSRELLVSVSAALAQLCVHENTIRMHMKEVRTREEGLHDLQRRRRQVGTKAESAEKKLNKMSPKDKQLQAQQGLLNQLREEIRLLDSTILTQEAQLGDYKRQTTKDWMTLKFGGLSELAERVMIVGNTGKQLMESIPLDQTQPGVARAPYVGQAETSKLFISASQRIGQVKFQSAPSDFTYHNEPDPEAGHEEGQAQDFAEPHTASTTPVEFAQPQDDLQAQPRPTSHYRSVSSPTVNDFNPSLPPETHTRSVTLSGNFGRPTPLDEPPSPAIQPGNLAPPPNKWPRPSSAYASLSRRRLVSGLSETGSDGAGEKWMMVPSLERDGGE